MAPSQEQILWKGEVFGICHLTLFISPQLPSNFLAWSLVETIPGILPDRCFEAYGSLECLDASVTSELIAETVDEIIWRVESQYAGEAYKHIPRGVTWH